MSQADVAWIQEIRTKHLRLNPHIKPHFTWVFPIDHVALGELFGHVQQVTQEIQPIDF